MLFRIGSRLARASSLIALLCAAACKREAPPPVPASSAPAAVAPSNQAAAQPPEFPPLPSREALPTTSSNIAIGNLEGDVQNGEKMLAAAPNNSGLMMRMVPLFLMHAKTVGAIYEYDRALMLAEAAAKLEPKNPQSFTTLSSVHSTLHRFTEALADLKRAEALGATGTSLNISRASLLQALGRFAEARPILEKLATENPSLETIGAVAALEADEGHIAEAEKKFLAALNEFGSTTPFPLVWLWFQQGLMWQKEGRLARARELFAAAHERLPEDVAVASHLASMYAATGDRQRAIAILWKVIRSADDPEYKGQLSQLLREDGDAKEADDLRTQAIARYETLIKVHPAAFAEHAARFWLGPGADPKKALPLAKLNLEQRKTPDAYALAIEAGQAAGEPAAATCQLAESATAPPAQPPARLRVIASRAFIACGKKDRADAELRAIAAPTASTTPAPVAASTTAAPAK